MDEGSTRLNHYQIYEISTHSMQFYERISTNYNPTGIARKSRLTKTTIQQGHVIKATIFKGKKIFLATSTTPRTLKRVVRNHKGKNR